MHTRLEADLNRHPTYRHTHMTLKKKKLAKSQRLVWLEKFAIVLDLAFAVGVSHVTIGLRKESIEIPTVFFFFFFFCCVDEVGRYAKCAGQMEDVCMYVCMCMYACMYVRT